MKQTSQTILFESDVLQDIALLRRVWKQPDTFVLLPDHLDVDIAWIENALKSLPEQFSHDHFALLTSGSTGRPKLIIGSRKRTSNLASVLHEQQASEPVKRTILSLPISYSYAFVNQFVWSNLMERELVVTRGLKEADQLERVLASTQDAMLCMVGAQVPLFIRHFSEKAFSGIIRLHFAGGQFPQQWIAKLQQIFPAAQIFNNYGCAEAMPRLSLRRLEESEEGANIGHPLPGITMTADADKNILFRSPYRAVAFYSDDTYKVLTDEEWVPSGDLGEEINDGYWRILGRSNEVFKRYGEKVAFPRLLETVYGVWSQHAAVYRESDPSGEDGYVLVLAPEPEKAQVQAVLQAFRKNFPRALWPLRLESVPQIPLLNNGKTDVFSLKNTESKAIHWEQRIS